MYLSLLVDFIKCTVMEMKNNIENYKEKCKSHTNPFHLEISIISLKVSISIGETISKATLQTTPYTSQ